MLVLVSNLFIMSKNVLLPAEFIERKIYYLRGKKVMIDFDLAELYGVPTKRLNEQVKRNSDRFPEDFMFHLTQKEFESLKSHFATSNARGGMRKRSFAFTEQGVSMLSSVLRSPRAVKVNIEIMRTFVQLREILSTHKQLSEKLEKLESKYDSQFKIVFDAIRALMAEPDPEEKAPIGFQAE
jgi:hypothetical protein